MIKLLYKGHNRPIIKAVKKANDALQSVDFYEKVASLPQMSNTNLSSPEIASILMANNQEIVVQCYWNPFGKPTKIKQPCLFMVNTYNLSCITAFVVNTLINETILSLALKCDSLNFEKINADEMEYPNIFPRRLGEVAEIITRKNKLSRLKTQFQ